MARKYELVCILDPQVGENQFEPLVEKYAALIQAQGCELVHTERWGLRKLAFTSPALRKRQQGYYVLYQFAAPSSKVLAVLEHDLKLDESVLRFLFVAVDGEFIRVPQLAPEDVYIFTAPPRRDGGRGGRYRDRRDGDRDRRDGDRRDGDRRDGDRRPDRDRRPAPPDEGGEGDDEPVAVAGDGEE